MLLDFTGGFFSLLQMFLISYNYGEGLGGGRTGRVGDWVGEGLGGGRGMFGLVSCYKVIVCRCRQG